MTKSIIHIIIIRDKLNKKLLTSLCYFNLRWDNRPFWRLDWGPHYPWMSSWWIPCNLQDSGAGLKAGQSTTDRQQWLHIQYQVPRVNVVYWQCLVRPKGNPCKALVMERSGGFQSNSTCHNHQPAAGAATAAENMVAVKAEAIRDLFKPAPAIVNEVI